MPPLSHRVRYMAILITLFAFIQSLHNVASADERYVVTVDNFVVQRTRSTSTDTDYITLAAYIDQGTPLAMTKYIGDAYAMTCCTISGSGIGPVVPTPTPPYDVSLSLPSLVVGNGSTLTLKCLIMNKGTGGAGDVASNLAKLAQATATLFGSGGIGAAIVGADAVLTSALPGWFNSGACDGVVVADEISLSRLRLDDLTRSGPAYTYSEKRDYEGTDTPHGCGRNSEYSVTYRITRAFSGEQADWRWCNKCGMLFFNDSKNQNPCPGGGRHDAGGSWKYVLAHDVSSAATQQADWRWCNKCGVLFFGDPNIVSRCQAGGAHNLVGSWNYVLTHDAQPAANQQVEWRWCRKCNSLFFNDTHNQGKCPAGGAHEQGSWNYCLKYQQ